MIYVGVLSNRGKRFNDEEEALSYAFERLGIMPSGDWIGVDEEFSQMLLEWFYSGDWIVTEDADEAGVDESVQDKAYDWLSGKVRWDAEQIRRGSRL